MNTVTKRGGMGWKKKKVQVLKLGPKSMDPVKHRVGNGNGRVGRG